MLGSTYLEYFLGPHKLHDVVGDLQQLLPQCAIDCLTSALETVSTCSPENATCICTDPNVALGMHHCADNMCTIRQALVALNVTASVCQRPIRDNTIRPIVIGGVSGSLSILAALLRTVDTVIDGHFGWDDACALGAGITSIPMTGFLLRIAFAGLGRDTWTLSPDRITYIQKLEWLTQIFYLPTTALPKLAFLLMYLRVFPQKQLRCYIHATIALTIFYWLFFEISLIFYCRPMSLIWEKWDGEHEGKCWNINYLILSAAGATVCLHLLIILLPIPALLQLSMTYRKKFEVIAVFAVGAFILLVSCGRISAIINYAKSLNPTWDNAPSDYWSVLEANNSVFCVCMPAMRRLIVRRLKWHSNRGTDSVQSQVIAVSDTSPRGRQSTNDNVEDVEYPWERTTVPIEQNRRRQSKDTTTSRDERFIASYMRAAEIECVELHEGPGGEQVLLRRGVDSREQTSKTLLPATYMPSFEDDD